MVLSTLFMALTSFTNPGLIARPPASARRAHFERFQERREQTPPYLLVEPSGGVIEVSTKYCTVCGIVRPPRASHCRETDRCIERWDNYCPWVGTAVGRRNYGWFVAFVLTSTLLALYVACASFAHLRYAAAVLIASERRSVTPHATPAWVRSAFEAPISCLLVGYGLVVGAMLTVLSFYHLFLIATNQTTYEHVRGTYDEPGSNPFDRGLVRNCLTFLLPRCFPPLPLKPSESIEYGSGEGGGGGSGGGVAMRAKHEPSSAYDADTKDLEAGSVEQLRRSRRGAAKIGSLRGGDGEPAAKLAVEMTGKGDSVKGAGSRSFRLPDGEPPPSPTGSYCSASSTEQHPAASAPQNNQE